MAPNTTTIRSNNNLYFIVGGLFVALVVGVFAYNTGYFGGNAEQATPSVDSNTTTQTTTP